MRLFKKVFLATLVSAGVVGLCASASAQAVPGQVIGPLYAYGPSAVPPQAPPNRQPRYQPRFSNPDNRAWQRFGGYGRGDWYGLAMPYAGYAARPSPRYYNPRYRGRLATPYRYRQPGYPDYAYRPRYAARILTPYWNSGPQQARGIGIGY